jgi:hypothetical protein
MINEDYYRTVPWNPNEGEDGGFAKKAILEILKSQKVLVSIVRCLFNSILRGIKDNNPVTL